jgi:cytochrome c-type biogenesis protein CcmH/NrfG
MGPETEGRGAGTLAEAVGLTGELGEAIADLAERELAAGRNEAARVILEGLVVSNPREARGWILLARIHRGLGQPLAARFCAEVAAILQPDLPEALLARAEGLLPFEEERDTGLALLERLAGGEGGVAARATALRVAAGGRNPPKEAR